MNRITQILVASVGFAVLMEPQSGSAAVTQVIVGADTFINSGSPDNNAGGNPWFDAGTDGQNSRRRGLIRFDLSAIPPGSTVTSATLNLTVIKVPSTAAVDSTFDLFRLTAGWNEGDKVGNAGLLATSGEATWNSSMHGTVGWSVPGARSNTAPSVSASRALAGAGSYAWTGPGLVSDIQAWVDNPGTNFGWLIMCEAESSLRSVRGFAARENGTNFPMLEIGYTPPPVIALRTYAQHNLVSDIPGFADNLDTNMLNPWGIAFSASWPFWISDNHAGVSTLYDSAGAAQSLVVTIPPPNGGTPPAAPTGVVFNSSPDFLAGPGLPAHYIFATEDGTIVAWNNGADAVLKADNSASGAIYKGIALGNSGGKNFVYAANFHAGQVDVFDANFSLVSIPGSFADPGIPAGFAPFNIQNFGGQLFVTYAKQDTDAHDDVSGPGNGCVDIFDTGGNLIKRFASNGALNSPWGMAMAPAGFGAFGGALLIGNFGDGRINAFDPATGLLLGALQDTSGNPISIEGLWGLAFGNGARAGDKHTLYFTAGISGGGAVEDHGLFGSISAVVPEIAAVSDLGIAVNISWTGGVGPFLLQKKSSMSESWWNVLTTTKNSATVAKDGQAGYYRILNQAQTNVMPFTVALSGAAENPVINTPGQGVGTLSIEGNLLTYHISYSGLSAPATLAHIHGPADATTSAGVLIPFPAPSGTAGTIAGTQTLTDAQLQAITNGLTYVNIHTTAHGSGEIRGQIVPLQLRAVLNGSSEVPPINTAATGTATLTMIGSQMIYEVAYSGLLGNATASHIHGPADTTHSSGVLVPLNNPTGTAGSFSGQVSLPAVALADVLAGLSYINIHNTTNQGGEIRGQITR